MWQRRQDQVKHRGIRHPGLLDKGDAKGSSMTNQHPDARAGVSRRNLFGGLALGILMPRPLSAAEVAQRLDQMDASTLYVLLRGMILLERLNDPFLNDEIAALLRDIGQRMPHAPLLIMLYRALGDRGAHPSGVGQEPDLPVILHTATADAVAIRFDYVDLQDQRTTRTVYPLAMIHPAGGAQLLAWCTLRSDYRTFFATSMAAISRTSESFGTRRTTLLRGLLEAKGIDVPVVTS